MHSSLLVCLTRVGSARTALQPGGHVGLLPAGQHNAPVDPGRLAGSVDLRDPPHAHQRVAADRSSIFCRLRTLFRPPSRDAAKIRCRSRRASSSAWPQFTWSQPGRPSSGPFTGTGADAIAPAPPFTVSSLLAQVAAYAAR